MGESDLIKARRIAEEVMAFPPSEHPRRLEESCGGDETVRALVERLLADAASATSFLEENKFDLTSESAPPVGAPLPEQIGPFKITRLIAAGGWSVVYEGLQDRPRRRVAIKVLHASLTSGSALQRFTYESEVLARLRHPGIAEIYHAGTFDSTMGRSPYFALELVEEAMHIDAWSARHHLPLDQRLKLCVELCDIVHYGHTRGVVHCDLKPGNILIDRDGRVRVIDFGIAMALGDEGLQPGDITETGRIVGTIRYMAPEQFAGDLERIDARTDVRALGVVMYELLTGQKPWDLSGVPTHEAMQIVQTKRPVPPGQVSARLRGDLDTIITTAMSNDPLDRYASALELRQDIDRYRASLPILARPPSTVRMAHLFVRRHRFSVSVAVLVAFALCAALVVSLVAWRRAIDAGVQAKLAAAQAEREAGRAMSTTTVLTDMFSLAHPAVSSGGAIGVERMLDEATEYTGTAFANDAEAAAEIRRALVRIQLGVGDLDGASTNLAGIPMTEHPENPAELETELLRARVEHVRGEMAEAENRLQRLIEGNPFSLDPSIIEAYGTLAAVRVEQLNYAAAAPLLEVAIDRAVRSLGPDDQKTIELQAQLGRANAGLIMMRLPQAPSIDEPPPYGGLDRVLEVLGPTHPASFLARLSELDRTFILEGPGPGTLASLQSIHEDAQVALGPLHPRTLETSIELAGFLEMLGRHSEAEALLRDSVDAYDATFGPGHAHAAIARLALGQLLLAREQTSEAAAFLEQSRRANLALWGDRDPRTIDAEANLATALMRLDRLEEALPYYHRARVAMVETPFLGRNAVYWALREALVAAALRAGELDLAVEQAEALQAELNAHLDPDSALSIRLQRQAQAALGASAE